MVAEFNKKLNLFEKYQNFMKEKVTKVKLCAPLTVRSTPSLVHYDRSYIFVIGGVVTNDYMDLNRARIEVPSVEMYTISSDSW